MAKKFPRHAKHPERICWGCDKYCPANSLQCGNGSERTQHPAEIFGEDWFEWGLDFAEQSKETATHSGQQRQRVHDAKSQSEACQEVHDVLGAL